MTHIWRWQRYLRNVGFRLPRDAASYPRRTESSATPLRKHKNLRSFVKWGILTLTNNWPCLLLLLHLGTWLYRYFRIYSAIRYICLKFKGTRTLTLLLLCCTVIVLLCYYLCHPMYWSCVLYHCHRVLTQLQSTNISIYLLKRSYRCKLLV